MSNSPRVAIILLNYCGVEDTKACLESLSQLTYSSADIEIFVVDNASPDDSLAKLGAMQKDPTLPKFHLIASEKNLGYSGGNNLAIQQILNRNLNIDHPDTEADADALPIDPKTRIELVWLLNNDTTVDPNSLTYMVEQTQSSGGIVGSLILYPDKTYQQVGTQIDWRTGGTKGYSQDSLQDKMSIECLSGASMLVPTSVFKRIGLLEESYFLYFEDAEFCLRAGEKRIPKTLALQARVYHYEGKTTGKHSLSTQYYYHRNRLKLLFSYASATEKLTIGMYASFRLFRSVVKSMLDPKPERKTSVAVQKLAMKDFYEGVTGPCPHNLQAIQ